MIPDARAEALARVAPMWYELCCPEVLSAKVSAGAALLCFVGRLGRSAPHTRLCSCENGRPALI